MNKRLILLILSLFLSVFALTVNAHDGPATNKDGSIVTGVLTAGFDPFGNSYPEAVLPFPASLAFFTSTDLTLDIPVEDPDNIADPRVSLSAMDGFSNVEKWVVSFIDTVAGGSRYLNPVPGKVDPTSVIPGKSVRVFEVIASRFLFVTSIVEELTPGVDYHAQSITADKVAIIPLKPLKEYTSYMAVITNDIRDVDGNDATPDRAYNFGKTQDPWVDENGNSTNALFDDTTAALLELIRQAVQTYEQSAAAYGINPDDIVLAWTVHTQSKSRSLKTLRALAQPAPTSIAPTGQTTKVIGGFGIADIYMGVITLPYYMDPATETNPAAHLSSFWQAEPGAYAPPFDQIPLDPTSTHITIANPIPVKKSDQTVPIMVTVPNAFSQQPKPENGWPVVIYGHGFTRNRLDSLAVADTLASIGYAVVAIDFPWHGVSPDAEPTQKGFWIEAHPIFGPVANERTFDADLVNNETNAFVPDGLIDASGITVIPAGVGSMRTGRDLMRQGIADLSVVAVSLSSMDIDLDAKPDLDASNVAYVGHSWGGIHGPAFVAIEPIVTRAFLSAMGGGNARSWNASDTFGPVIESLLKNLAGIEPGSADYESFLTTWQTLLDSADGINWAVEAATNTPIMLHEVIGDTVVPNGVLTAPLSGTEPMIPVMGLKAYSTTQQSLDGLRSAGRFIPPATHGSLLSPLLGSPAATAEMQRQMASFIASFGGAILVTDESTMVQEVQVQLGESADLSEKNGSKKAKSRKGNGPVNKVQLIERPGPRNKLNRADRFK
jgi:pimeloyl-ACP methyl ester carboxylesterase